METYWYRLRPSCHLSDLSYLVSRRIQSHSVLTPIRAPMSDTVRSQSIERNGACQEVYIRLAHL